ncbi:MAG: hypothetical protein ACK5II_02810 [Paracoccus sp. (in: a-proteobacteria)]
MIRNLIAAFFLACTWFWCIGGFFPVLIIREFGPEIFFFFFTFNTIGAAAFGFAWTNESRQNFLKRHGNTVRLFSLIVVGYHLVFVSWLAGLLENILILPAYLLAVAAFWGLRHRLFEVSVGLFGVTIMLFGLALGQPAPDYDYTVNPVPASVLHGILPLALGFLLAPYFDLTFHRAYVRSPQEKISFLIGLIVLFGVLLIGVYASVGLLETLLSPRVIHPAGLWFLIGIMVLQFAFTSSAHLMELATTGLLTLRLNLLVAGVTGGLVAVYFMVVMRAPELRVFLGLLTYRSFVFTIGGLFPLLILYRWDYRFVGAGVLVMVPCYGLGFLIGGIFVPFLSVAMVGLTLLWVVQRWYPIPAR